VIHYLSIIESVKRDRVGFLVREDVAGDAFVVISKFIDSVLVFCDVCGVEVVSMSRVIRAKERDGVTWITTGWGKRCASLELTRK
jgi:hypothetical protein